ncbi:MAG TPA: hypothetical protein PLF11_05365 [Bacillota bacterium]|nr:hypothetical protein [Bacillota bacterium]
MASIDSDIYVVQNTQPAPAGYGSQIGASFAYYEATIAVADNFDAASDTAKLFVVPAGYRAVPNLWHINCEALGTAATLHIGTAADPDCIAASVDVKDAASVDATGGVEWLTPTTTTKATTFIATLATATSLTAGKKIVIRAVFAKM